MAGEFESILNSLGDVVYTQAETGVGNGKWTEACLDARFNKHEGSWTGKIRASKVDGSKVSLSLNNEISLGLIDLEDCRGEGTQEWFGILLTVRPDRRCHVGLNYDERCASDQTFYDT